jgi:hypothetical protein
VYGVIMLTMIAMRIGVTGPGRLRPPFISCARSTMLTSSPLARTVTASAN